MTEQILGRWLAQGGGRREKIVLATKVYGRMGGGPNDSRLSAAHIRRACEESLRRLATDHIDLYQMHHVDRDTPWDEIWQAMEQLVAQGKVLYVGSSNFAAWHIVDAQRRRRAAELPRHRLGAEPLQSQCADDRARGDPGLPGARRRAASLEPARRAASSAACCTKIREGRRSAERIQKRIAEKRAQLERWERFCAELAAEPADVAIAWMLANPAITAPIIGPRTVAQLEGSLRSLEVKLSKEALATLDEIWPGPGGEAPEAYAW